MRLETEYGGTITTDEHSRYSYARPDGIVSYDGWLYDAYEYTKRNMAFSEEFGMGDSWHPDMETVWFVLGWNIARKFRDAIQ